MLESWDWKERAACKHQLPLFFPSSDKKMYARDRAKIIAICASCPVMEQCRRFAEENHEDYGIWGGKDFTDSERERIRLDNIKRRQRNKDASSGSA